MAKFFKLQPSEYDLLIRCVKCNDLNLALITSQEASLYLDFKNVYIHHITKNQSYEAVKEFWQCVTCK